MNNNWVIVGFTGAGKTTALHVIEDLDIKHQVFDRCIDLDHSFETFYQHPGAFIKEYGFNHFRAKELSLLKKELVKSTKQIISVGGGAIHEESLLWLKSAGVKILAIDCSFKTCWERIKNDPNRPITNLTHKEIMSLFEARRTYWLKADYLLRNNGDYQLFIDNVKAWYSCQAAADV